MPDYRWKPIEGLPEELLRQESSELKALGEVWAEQKARLAESDGFREFIIRFNREWAIETGVIEGVYSLDRGVTQTLIERGIDSALIDRSATNRDPEWVVAMIRAHYETVDGLFQFVKGERFLSKSYINELHAALTRHQHTVTALDTTGKHFETEMLRGVYKRWPNNPTRSDGSINESVRPSMLSPRWTA